jgi:hypothetical protein
MNEQITQATALVDQAISKISGQQLVSSAEMTDLLLDIRLHLMMCEVAPEPVGS